MKNLKHLTSSGQATLAALMAAAVLSIGIYFTTNAVVRFKQQAVKLEQDLEYRFALQSTMDFVIFGIKQKYCFDAVLMQDSNCDLNHAASVPRIVMSAEQESYIKELIASGKLAGVLDPVNIHLDSIEKKLLLGSVSTEHPLYTIYNNENLKKYAAGIQVKIKRDNNLYLPRYSDEVYLSISVELIGIDKSVPLVIGSKKMMLNSVVSVHPREVGTFALLVTKDLRLDMDYNLIPSAGDSVIHNFGAKVQTQGLIFQSPVFVNQNIYLPKLGSSYTPVTFADRVYMGNGKIMKDSVAYKPATAGGSLDRSWNQEGTFGGFLNGVENDGGLDQGLLYFGKVSNATPVDPSLLKACIYRTQSLVDNNILTDNYINTYIKEQTQYPSYAKVKYRLTLSNGDEFNPQKIALDDSYSSTWYSNGGKFYRQTESSSKGKPIANVTFSFLNNNITELIKAELAYSNWGKESVTLQIPNNGLTKYINDNKNKLNSLYSDLNIEKTKLNFLVAELNKLNQEKAKLANLQQQLNNELGKKTPDPNTINQLQNDISDSKDTINKILAKHPDLNTEIVASKAEIQKISEQIDLLTALLNDLNGKTTAFLKISMQEVYDKYGKLAENKADLVLEFTNPEIMVDSNGKRFDFQINVQAYDLTYQEKKPISLDQNGKPIVNPDLNGTLLFTTNGSKLKFPENLTSASPDVVTTVEDPIDYNNLDVDCEQKRNAKSSQAFGTAAFNTDFSKMTRHSWNFAGTNTSMPGQDPLISTFTFDGTNASSPANSSFQVRSIVGTCLIKSTATFVTGFLGCDKLVIEQRNTPLRIIASIIAGSLSIHPTALQAGITWSSIYHPQATTELRKWKILQPLSGGPNANCSTVSINSSSPVWHPLPSMQDHSNRANCNAISLREKADPFRWTAVDPDCALTAGASNTVCKNSLVNFLVYEHSREGDL